MSSDESYISGYVPLHPISEPPKSTRGPIMQTTESPSGILESLVKNMESGSSLMKVESLLMQMLTFQDSMLSKQEYLRLMDISLNVSTSAISAMLGYIKSMDERLMALEDISTKLSIISSSNEKMMSIMIKEQSKNEQPKSNSKPKKNRQVTARTRKTSAKEPGAKLSRRK